jgi:uncharacterized protein
MGLDMLIRWVVDRPRATLALVGLFALVLLAGARNTHFVSDFDGSLPARSPLSQQVHAVQERFASRNTIAFLVSGGTASERLGSACALAGALERTPGVAAGRVYGAGSNTLKHVTASGDALAAVGLADVCLSPDGLSAPVLESLGPQRALVMAPSGALTIYADLDVVSGEFGPLLGRIDQEIGKARQGAVSIVYSGQPAFLAQNDVFSRRIALFFPIIVALILILHWEALRSVQAVVAPIATGLAATAMGLGVYGWLKQPLDTYTVLAPVLILAVGAGHSVQLLKRYMEELALRAPIGARATKEANAAAIEATLRAMAPVLSLAVLGASACLFALLLLDVSALARFGLLAGVGIVCALILELTAIPAVRVLLRPPLVKAHYGELSGFWQSGLEKLGEVALNGPKGLIAAGLVLVAAVLGLGVLQVKPSHSMSVYTQADVPVQGALNQLAAAGVGPYVLDVMIDAGRPEGAFDPAIQAAALDLAAKLETDPSVKAVLSPAAIIGFLKCRFDGAAGCAHVRAALKKPSRSGRCCSAAGRRRA